MRRKNLRHANGKHKFSVDNASLYFQFFPLLPSALNLSVFLCSSARRSADDWRLFVNYTVAHLTFNIPTEHGERMRKNLMAELASDQRSSKRYLSELFRVLCVDLVALLLPPPKIAHQHGSNECDEMAARRLARRERVEENRRLAQQYSSRRRISRLVEAFCSF